MSKVEDKILKMAGRETPFRVPDGYFENLTERIMDGLPEVEEKPAMKPVRISMWDRVKPWVYMAAMFVGAALIIRVATGITAQDKTVVATSDDMEWEMSYLDNVMDYSMMDSYQLYVYLSEEDDME